MRELQRCGRCGTRPDEWQPSKGGRHDAYVASLSICPGCEKSQTFQANLPKEGLAKGAHVRLVPQALLNLEAVSNHDH